MKCLNSDVVMPFMNAPLVDRCPKTNDMAIVGTYLKLACLLANLKKRGVVLFLALKVNAMKKL